MSIEVRARAGRPVTASNAPAAQSQTLDASPRAGAASSKSARAEVAQASAGAAALGVTKRVAASQLLKVGSSGPAVTALKDRLRTLKYAVDAGDRFTMQTRDAVMAFQKVNDLARDGVAGPKTQAALARPKAVQLGSGAANRIDVDLSSQVLTVVKGGKVSYIINATSGNPNLADGKGSATPKGSFQVQRKIAGTRNAPLGALYYPSYFRGGYAVHGSNSIVAQPASHGCVRVPRSLEQRVFKDMPVGSAVVIHE